MVFNNCSGKPLYFCRAFQCPAAARGSPGYGHTRSASHISWCDRLLRTTAFRDGSPPSACTTRPGSPGITSFADPRPPDCNTLTDSNASGITPCAGSTTSTADPTAGRGIKKTKS